MNILLVLAIVFLLVAIALERKEQAEGDDLTGMEVRLGMLGLVGHHAINLNEQADDKIVGRHANLHT
ncbi:MAG TPA: hypothetical protein VLA19_08960 [Herpetosiphonaceae bacterium]|nr:hypothetical protein [Herpetosiphonaceae bacterium]